MCNKLSSGKQEWYWGNNRDEWIVFEKQIIGKVSGTIALEMPGNCGPHKSQLDLDLCPDPALS